jgi:hypothetical protein
MSLAGHAFPGGLLEQLARVPVGGYVPLETITGKDASFTVPALR